MKKALLKIGYFVFDATEKQQYFVGQNVVRIFLIGYFKLIFNLLKEKTLDINLKIGTLYLNLNSIQTARKYYDKASLFVRDDTGLTRVLMCLGNLYLKDGSNQIAIEYYEKALSISSYKTTILSNLAFANEKIGEYAKSLSYAEQSIKVASEEKDLGHTIPPNKNVELLIGRLRNINP